MYLILMNLVLLCLLFPTITVFFFGEISSLRDVQLERTILNLRKSLEGRGISLTRSLSLNAEQAIAGYDYTFLNNMMAQVVENDPEIIYALVMNNKGLVMAHNQIAMVGNTIEDDLSMKAMAYMKRTFAVNIIGQDRLNIFKIIEAHVHLDEKQIPIFEIVTPIYSGAKLSGVLRCGFSLEGLTSEINRTKQEWAEKMARIKVFFMSITTIFFFIGMLVALFFTRLFVRSTTILTEGVRQIASGDLTHEIPSHLMFCREFDHFSSSFNEMTTQLRSSLNQLDKYNRSLEQKVEERTKDLKDAQAVLFQQAHEAGMAEMAVGVLHNIGNAITPAKVNATLLVRRLQASPMRTSLAATSNALAQGLINSENLSLSDRKRFIKILNLLPASLCDEYDRAIKDLEKICSSHEHIEDIINLQMRYAKLIDGSEEVNLNMVVEDALQMLNESIQQRKIEVQKDLENIPLIRIEQAKIIQIVINLIKNAYEAMDMAELPDRRITITTSYIQEEQSRIILSVADTGCGFSPDENKKLFQFGYTTKQTGSGFGLHSCANYVTAHNGTLTATSAGKGKGAEFTVQFQISRI